MQVVIITDKATKNILAVCANMEIAKQSVVISCARLSEEGKADEWPKLQFETHGVLDHPDHL